MRPSSGSRLDHIVDTWSTEKRASSAKDTRYLSTGRAVETSMFRFTRSERSENLAILIRKGFLGTNSTTPIAGAKVLHRFESNF